MFRSSSKLLGKDLKGNLKKKFNNFIPNMQYIEHFLTHLNTVMPYLEFQTIKNGLINIEDCLKKLDFWKFIEKIFSRSV